MTTIRRSIASALAVLVVLAMSTALPGTASADPGGRPMHGRPERGAHFPGELLLRASNLTTDQSARVKSILSAHHATMRALFEQLRQARNDLSDRLNGAAPVDMAALEPQIKRIGGLEEQLLQDRVQMMTEIRGLLTPDQLARVQQARDRLKQIRAELRQLFHEPGR